MHVIPSVCSLRSCCVAMTSMRTLSSSHCVSVLIVFCFLWVSLSNATLSASSRSFGSASGSSVSLPLGVRCSVTSALLTGAYLSPSSSLLPAALFVSSTGVFCACWCLSICCLLLSSVCGPVHVACAWVWAADW